MAKKNKEVKNYHLVWIDDSGKQWDLGTRQTNTPKHLLFNEMCAMRILAPNTFQFQYDKLMDNIRIGRKAAEMGREHYVAEADGVNGLQVLSLLEV